MTITETSPREDHDEPTPLTVTLSFPRPHTVVCTALGEVDITSAPLLREQIQKALNDEPRYLVVDLSAVTFFCAAGIHVLAEARIPLAEEHELMLVATDRTLVRVLDICDLTCRRYLELGQALAACQDVSLG